MRHGETTRTEGASQRAASPSRRPKGVRQKTYVVLQKSFKQDPHHPNTKVVAVKLTEEAAQSVVDEIPGTYIERHIATKTKYRR